MASRKRRDDPDSGVVDALPEDQRTHLLREASVYAAGKLAEVETRAHFVHETHGEVELLAPSV